MGNLKEMMQQLGYTPQEIRSTVEYAEKCNLQDKLSKAFTDFFSNELKLDENNTTAIES